MLDVEHSKLEVFGRYKDKFFVFFREHRTAKLLIASSLFIIFLFFILAYRAPSGFPVNQLLVVEEGMGLSEISASLKSSSVIRSRLLFELFVTLLAGDNGALHGDYFFNKKVSVFRIARKITKGEFGLTPVKILIPEGSTIYDIANLFEKQFPKFDSVSFLKDAHSYEGYLFPDTYNFLPNVKYTEVVPKMNRVFNEKIEGISEDISSFGEPLGDIIIMASILEKEARTTESRRTIAGILWKRIEIGMPLQVDAVFPYINGKNTYQLTLEDLKIDSPYNTYLYNGLPIGPIANPGLDSIKAAINPIASPYLFYLSDRNGNMHYAEDFEGHKENKRLYLN